MSHRTAWGLLSVVRKNSYHSGRLLRAPLTSRGPQGEYSNGNGSGNTPHSRARRASPHKTRPSNATTAVAGGVCLGGLPLSTQVGLVDAVPPARPFRIFPSPGHQGYATTTTSDQLCCMKSTRVGEEWQVKPIRIPIGRPLEMRGSNANFNTIRGVASEKEQNLGFAIAVRSNSWPILACKWECHPVGRGNARETSVLFDPLTSCPSYEGYVLVSTVSTQTS